MFYYKKNKKKTLKFYLCLMNFWIELYGIKYSYLILIISPHFYGFKYSYLILFAQLQFQAFLSNTSNFQTSIWPIDGILKRSLRVRLDLGLIAIKENCFTLLRAPELEPHHHIWDFHYGIIIDEFYSCV